MNQIQKSRGGKPWLRRTLLAVLALSAAGLALWRPVSTPPSVQPSRQQTPSRRDIREEAYQQDLQALRALLETESTDQAARQQAQNQLMRMVSEHQTELGLEDALQKAGYTPCLVLCQNDALTVMIQDLTAADSAAVLALCAAHTEIRVENIRIMAP